MKSMSSISPLPILACWSETHSSRVTLNATSSVTGLVGICVFLLEFPLDFIYIASHFKSCIMDRSTCIMYLLSLNVSFWKAKFISEPILICNFFITLMILGRHSTSWGLSFPINLSNFLTTNIKHKHTWLRGAAQWMLSLFPTYVCDKLTYIFVRKYSRTRSLHLYIFS